MSDWHNIPNVRDTTKWYNDKGRMKLNFFLSIIFVGMILNGYDGNIIAGLQAFDAWHEDLGNPGGVGIGLLNASGYISGLLVGPVIAYIDEHFGRKWGIRFYGYCLLIGSIIGCVAGVKGINGYAAFICGRVVIGFGLASFLLTSLAVVQEIPHPRSRSVIAQSWDSYYIIGSTIAAWVIFGTSYISNSWSWRIPYILQVPMALYCLIAVQFVPETPRFLISKGRDEEALQFLADYHGNGNYDDPLVLFEFNEIREAINQEKAAKAEQWTQILKSRSNLHRLFLAVLMMFLTNMSGSSIIYFYYTIVFESVGITNPTTQTGINAGLNVFTWICQIAFVYVGKHVGRRPILLWLWPCLLVALAGLCASSGVYSNSADGNTHAAVATVVLVWLYQGAFNCSNPVLYSYPAEVQTFSMRSKGLLVWNTVSQFTGAYVVFVDAVALDSIGYKYYPVYMGLVIIQWVLVYLYMVETKGYTLEEIAQAFEGSTVNLVPAEAYIPADYEAQPGNAAVDDKK
ncbi:general substrate transporter [Kockovaella imperatae]|uniref:General substrate transporter n=1 Tax=Kockovaella imperatae TaxID=4999 RepID=A0A1Y1UHF2_9TREE|nr:general substrate transporter [Kockovaella imperatae]ORX37419.1 general substrate transporter [Kockovaella imperatae]